MIDIENCHYKYTLKNSNPKDHRDVLFAVQWYQNMVGGIVIFVLVGMIRVAEKVCHENP